MQNFEKDEGNKAYEMNYEEKVKHVSEIARPLASKNLTKKCYTLIKIASNYKNYLYNDLRHVQKKIRKGDTGIMIFAGDVYPIDVMCHMPAVCEEKNIPYCFTPSRQDLGNLQGLQRSILLVFIKEHSDYMDLYNECKSEMKTLSVPLT